MKVDVIKTLQLVLRVCAYDKYNKMDEFIKK